jgi:hypothetical protein
MLHCAMAIILFASIVWPTPQEQGARGWVIVRDEEGKIQGTFEPRLNPYTPSGCCPFRMPVRQQEIRTSDGAIVSALGFYGWIKGKGVQVQVVLMVPGPGAPNRYLWTIDRELLQPRELVAFPLEKIGQRRPVDEMKALGLKPFEISLEPKPKL